jgi:hypothetical protein
MAVSISIESFAGTWTNSDIFFFLKTNPRHIHISVTIFYNSYQYYENNNFNGNRVRLLFPHLNIMYKHNIRGGRVFFFKQVPAKLSIEILTAMQYSKL